MSVPAVAPPAVASGLARHRHQEKHRRRQQQPASRSLHGSLLTWLDPCATGTDYPARNSAPSRPCPRGHERATRLGPRFPRDLIEAVKRKRSNGKGSEKGRRRFHQGIQLCLLRHQESEPASSGSRSIPCCSDRSWGSAPASAPWETPAAWPTAVSRCWERSTPTSRPIGSICCVPSIFEGSRRGSARPTAESFTAASTWPATSAGRSSPARRSNAWKSWRTAPRY